MKCEIDNKQIESLHLELICMSWISDIIHVQWFDSCWLYTHKWLSNGKVNVYQE